MYKTSATHKQAILGMVLVAACRGGGADSGRDEPRASGSAAVPADSAPPSTDAPRLSMEREAFWRRFVGETAGTPGPEMLTWCLEPVTERERVDVEPYVAVTHDEIECGLRTSHAMADELRAFLGRWQPQDGYTWLQGRDTRIDWKNGLTAHILHSEGTPSSAARLSIVWHRHADMNTIIGTGGRVLRDLDLESLVDAPFTVMHEKVRPPLRLEVCTIDSCTARGPAPPGGVHIEIRKAPRWTRGVTVNIFGDPAEALSLIKQSLGRPTRETIGSLVFDRGSIRYTVDWESFGVFISLQRLPI